VSRSAVPRVVLGVAGVAVAAVVAGGVWLMGSPAEQRARDLDKRRVSDLRDIADDVGAYFKHHERLPESLADLAGESGLHVTIRDPGTGREYDYQALEAGAYRLCAEFGRESEGEARRAAGLGLGPGYWYHGAGRQCFDLRVGTPEPDL